LLDYLGLEAEGEEENDCDERAAMISKILSHKIMALTAVSLAMLLAGCGCFQQAMRGEAAPPAPEAAPAPAPAPEAAPYPAPAPEAAPALAPVPTLQPPLPPILLSSREYLIRGAREKKGYGLYSYILLPTKAATKKQFGRYMALHRAYVACLDVYSDVDIPSELRVSTENQNIVYWPLQVGSYSRIGNDHGWFVSNYGHEYADLILGKLSRVLRRGNPGPFIVSTRLPLASRRGLLKKGEAIVVDLSRIDEGQFETVFRIFSAKISLAPDSWNPTIDFGIIQTKCVSAIEIHGLQTLEALKFVKKWLVSDAFALESDHTEKKPNPTSHSKRQKRT
jgi:hypothetical protein